MNFHHSFIPFFFLIFRNKKILNEEVEKKTEEQIKSKDRSKVKLLVI